MSIYRSDKMTLLAVCCILMFSTVTLANDDFHTRFYDAIYKCMNESGVPKKVLFEALNSGVETDMKVKCVSQCQLTETQLVGTDGTIDESEMIKLLTEHGEIEVSEQEARAIVKKCNEEKVNSCDAAHKFMSCLVKKNWELHETHPKTYHHESSV